MHDSKTMAVHAEDVSVHDEATRAGLLETGIQLDAEERDMTLLQAIKHHKRVLFFCKEFHILVTSVSIFSLPDCFQFDIIKQYANSLS